MTDAFAEPVWLKQQRQLEKVFAAVSEPVWLKQQRQLEKVFAAVSEPAWLRQQRELQKKFAAMTGDPVSGKQQSLLLESLVAVGNMTGTAPTGWLDRIGHSGVAARAAQLIDDGALVPSGAMDISELDGGDQTEDSTLIGALPLLYELASPALRRKLQLTIASLAVATSFYIVALAERRTEAALENALGALLALWAVYHRFLELVEEAEAGTGASDALDSGDRIGD